MPLTATDKGWLPADEHESRQMAVPLASVNSVTAVGDALLQRARITLPPVNTTAVPEPTVMPFGMGGGGSILAAWAAQGAESGGLGYPDGDQTCGLVGGWCKQQFLGGFQAWFLGGDKTKHDKAIFWYML